MIDVVRSISSASARIPWTVRQVFWEAMRKVANASSRVSRSTAPSVVCRWRVISYW